MRHHAEQGFTLLELIITIVIIAIISTAALPSAQRLVEANKLKTLTHQIKSIVFLARSEAIRRGSRVFVCLSEDSVTCGSATPNELLVFEDADFNGGLSGSAKLISRIPIGSTDPLINYNRSFLSFNALGYAAGTNGTFTVCRSAGDPLHGEMLVVSTLGRVRQAKDSNGDGIVEKTPGTPMSC